MRMLRSVALLRTAALSSCLLAASVAQSADQGADQAPPRQGLILSHLPEPTSAGYAKLRAIAGPDAVQALEMTGSQMWSVDESRVNDLKTAAREQGVDVMTLDASANRAMTPMDATAPMSEDQSRMMHEAMSSQAAMGMAMMALPDPKVMEYALTKGMNGAKEEQPAELTLPLDAKTSVTARRTRVEKTPDGYVWHGTIEPDGDPVTLLWWPSGRLSGQITYRGHHYVVKNLGGNMHGVVEIAPRMLPPEHAPMAPGLMNKMHMREDPLVTKGDASMLPDMVKPAPAPSPAEPLRNLQDVPSKKADARSKAHEHLALITPPPAPASPVKSEPITIDLLVAYTPQAASHYTDIVKDLIDVAVEEVNQSFRNSGIDNVRVRLVHAYQTDYKESGSHFEHVFRFADKGDGYMDEVHGLRDQYKADIAALIVHDPNGCGLSAAVAPAADRAFTVVHHECAAVSYSLAHEIGHLIGARHNIALDDDKQPYPFGHGFVSGKDWRTMMSYEETCDGCPRIPIWSNPAVKVKGVPAGDDMSDNARVIREGAARVAGFR
jgi:hypothetical protein